PVMHLEGHPDFLEAVAGLLDADDPETCARRESREEAGLRVERPEPVGRGRCAPGATTERRHLCLAPHSEADRGGEGGGLADEHEEIEVIEVGFDELSGFIADGTIADMKTMVLAQALQLRHPQAFERD